MYHFGLWTRGAGSMSGVAGHLRPRGRCRVDPELPEEVLDPANEILDLGLACKARFWSETRNIRHSKVYILLSCNTNAVAIPLCFEKTTSCDTMDVSRNLTALNCMQQDATSVAIQIVFEQ